jgi:sterol desaturase/sphingolipid hydroxylase (fatty acid hydroxylase superfamily)
MPAMLMNTATNFAFGIAPVLAAMTVLSLVERLLPLHPRERLNDTHLGPNLSLTFITFLTNFAFNTALLIVLAWLQSQRFGLLYQIPLWAPAIPLIAILVLDFSTYIAHVSMHKFPFLWRFHSVHHSDLALDVTTTIRQHPGESLIRYVFMATTAIALGAGPATFVAYRLTSSLIGLLEHSNIGLPLWLDTLLSWFIASPNMHKVHHSRDRRYTDSNYGNIVALWDRLFRTFTPARLGLDICYGLEGWDSPSVQTIPGLLARPVRASST